MSSCPSLLLVLVAVVLSAENPVHFVGISPSCHLFLANVSSLPTDGSTACATKRLIVYRIGDTEDAHVGIVDVVNNRIRLQNLHFPSSALLDLKKPRKVWTNVTTRHHVSPELDYGYAVDDFVFSNQKDLFVIGRNSSDEHPTALFRFEVVEGEAFSLELLPQPRIDLLVDVDTSSFPLIFDFESARTFWLHHAQFAAIVFNGSGVEQKTNISAPSSLCSVRFAGKCVFDAAPVIPLDVFTTRHLTKKAVLFRSKRRHLRMTSPHVRVPRYEYGNLRGGWLFVMGILFGSLCIAFSVYAVVYRVSRGRLIS